jgi:hypothetical protein
LGPTVTSADVEENRWSKVRLSVSEKMSVPATNATDSRTASADSAMRPLWAKKLRNVALSIAVLPRGSETAVRSP